MAIDWDCGRAAVVILLKSPILTSCARANGQIALGAAIARAVQTVEGGRHAVVIACGERIEFVIVTAGTRNRLREKPTADHIELLIDQVHFELFFVLHVHGHLDERAIVVDLRLGLQATV